MSSRVQLDKFIRSMEDLEEYAKTIEGDIASIQNNESVNANKIHLISIYEKINKNTEFETNDLLFIRRENLKDLIESSIQEIDAKEFEKCCDFIDSINRKSTFQELERACKKVANFIEKYGYLAKLDAYKEDFETLQFNCYRIQRRLACKGPSKTHLVYPRNFGGEEEASSCPYTTL